jgi:hypothetical protein
MIAEPAQVSDPVKRAKRLRAVKHQIFFQQKGELQDPGISVPQSESGSVLKKWG